MNFRSPLATSEPPITLRVYREENPDPVENGSTLSPRMRLSTFAERWFFPVILVGERDSAAKTLSNYRTALDYWAKITSDPPINEIDEFTIAKFREGLRKATYRRGRFGQDFPLAEASQHRNLRNLRTILHRVGPTIDPNRRCKALVAEAPHIRLSAPRTRLKPAISLISARAMVAAASQMEGPTSVQGIGVEDWWRLRIAIAYYTGLRSGTIRGLRRRHLDVDDHGRTWLLVPSELVTKTDKEARVIVHPKLLEQIDRCSRGAQPDELLCPIPHCDRWIQELHERLQKLAGIPEAKWLSPHAWRRTHTDQLTELGCDYTTEIARLSLDHSDSKTTTSHYVDIVNKFRLRLPPLWTELPSDERQQLLF